jgi:hypothetical protein
MKRVAWMLSGLGGLALIAGFSRRRRSNAETLEQQFHASYDRMRTQRAHQTPVLVLFQDSLILLHGARSVEWSASAPLTHIIQAAAHAPVGVFAVLHELPAGAPLGPLQLVRLTQLHRACDADGELARLEPATRRDVEEVLERSRRFIDVTLADGRARPDALAQFAREVGPLLLSLIDHATQLALDALHTATEAALAQLDAAQRRELEVIVTGVHQARTRSFAMQYFQKRFAEAPGEERRVAYAEGASDPEEARSLVGTRRLDRAIASAFFGDEKRMQRDLLGDAAQHALSHRELTKIA